MTRTQARVAILTLTQSENYGTVLQAFATRQLLSRALDGIAEVTLVPTDPLKVRLRRFLSVMTPRPGSFSLTRASNFLSMRRFMREYGGQRRGFVNASRRSRVTRLLARNFDAYVTGSDEVWNLAYLGASSIYYLPPELPGPRYSLSTSANRLRLDQITSSTWEVVAQSLARYSLISVRDSFTRSVVERAVGEHSEVVNTLDPTLIYEFPELGNARRIIPSNPQGRRVLLMVRDRPIARALVNELGATHSLFSGFQRHEGTQFLSADPLAFMRAFEDVDFVVTDFFHGTCLSIRAGKQFLAFDREPGYMGVESKIADVTRRLGLDGNYLNLVGTPDREAREDVVRAALKAVSGVEPLAPLDLALLELERSKSLDYLRSIREHVRSEIGARI